MKKIFAIVLCLALMLSASAFAATIEATGKASVSITPDTAQLTLNIRAFLSDVNEAMSDVNSRIDKISKALKKMGVADEDIVAAGVYIYNNYDYETGLNTGYNVSREMTVTVKDITAVGNVIDVVLDAGANDLNGLTFTSSQRREAYDEALKLAVLDARKRAETMSYAQGVHLTGIASVKENENWSGNIYEYGGAGSASDDSTKLDIGSLTIEASVTAVYDAEEIIVE